MTAKYFAILTNYGAAQLANAVALGTQMNISAMSVGDGGGTLPVPDPAQTKLVRETRRAAVNQVSVDEKNPNFIIAEQVIPENEGGWFIREIGLFDDNGGLIAVGNAPETYKPNLQEGSGRTQVIQMVLMVSSTQAITLKVDPSVVLATREYVTKSVAAAIQESEARAAKTYQPIGDYVLNPFFKLEMLKKFDKADISQQLGNDTGKAPSLHLLTTEVGKLQPKGNYAPGSHFTVYGNESRMLSADQKLALIAHNTKTSGAWDDELQRMLWAFDSTGTLIHGTVPADRTSGFGTAALRTVGNLASQVPDMSLFPESGKWTDNGLTTLPNGVMIQAFKRIIANDPRTGYSMTSYVPFPTAFPNGVWAVLCTKTTYVQIVASCEGVTKQGFNIVTVKAVEAPTTESNANFLVLGY